MDLSTAVVRYIDKSTYILFMSDDDFVKFNIAAVIKADGMMLQFIFIDNTDIFVINRLDNVDIKNVILYIYAAILGTQNKTFNKIFNRYDDLNMVVVSTKAAMNEGYEYRDPRLLALIENTNPTFKVIDILIVGHNKESLIYDINKALVSKTEFTNINIPL